jgi:large subunit ribosomal protein L18
MNKKAMKEKRFKYALRKKRVFKNVGESGRTRLCVRKTLKHVYAQIIDDAKKVTIASAWDGNVEKKGKKPVEIAKSVGELVARQGVERGVKQVVFDRGAARYHGRVKAVADGAREAGLEF